MSFDKKSVLVNTGSPVLKSNVPGNERRRAMLVALERPVASSKGCQRAGVLPNGASEAEDVSGHAKPAASTPEFCARALTLRPGPPTPSNTQYFLLFFFFFSFPTKLETQHVRTSPHTQQRLRRRLLVRTSHQGTTSFSDAHNNHLCLCLRHNRPATLGTLPKPWRLEACCSREPVQGWRTGLLGNR